MNLWPVEHFFEYISHHFWVGLLLPPVGLLLHPPKSDDKYAQKSVQLVRGSYFRKYLFQNTYFKRLVDYLNDKHQLTKDDCPSAKMMRFPDRGTHIGQVINDYLKGKVCD